MTDKVTRHSGLPKTRHSGGVLLTDVVIAQAALEADVGYDVERLRPVKHPLEGNHECEELICCWCHQHYSIWFADDDLWNEVMRLHDGTDRVPFACPRCFLLHAQIVMPIARISRPLAVEP